MTPKRVVIFAFFWFIAFAAALFADSRVARWIHTSGTGRAVEGTWWAFVLKAPGNFAFTLAIVVILILSKKIQWRQAALTLLAGVLSGAHVFLKWIVGRTRPYKLPGGVQPRPFELHPFRDGLHGFFHQTNLSFPSGHVCPVTALAVSIGVVWPGRGRFFVPLVIVVGIERIAENAHYCSDVIGAVGFGVVGTLLLFKIIPNWAKPTQGRGFEIIP